MKKASILVVALVILALLVACGPGVTQTTAPPTTPPAATSEVPPEKSHLTPNPVEKSPPQYGGVIRFGQQLPANFDAHTAVAYAPTATLPVFNQLVMFDSAYKDLVPENIVGDLADSWDISPDGKKITFRLHQGVKWHDGVPFTAEDVVYSLDKMTDPNRSGISANFPAYDMSEAVDDYTVVVYLKYQSAGFMIALASGFAQIQPKHLAGTDIQSVDFMVGTGPFIVQDYLVRVHLIYTRNPSYFKKDQYGNQLPYLDGIQFLYTGNVASNEGLVARRLDLKNPVTGAGTLDTYNYLKNSAPELLWERRDKGVGTLMFLNLGHKPLDDIRVRRAFGLVLDEVSLIIGYAGDEMFGITDIGILPPAFGLPKGEVRRLMGWDKTYEERVAEAQRLMAEAGYAEGFKLKMIATGASGERYGANLVFADTLRKYLKIEAEVNSFTALKIEESLEKDDWDLYCESTNLAEDPIQLVTFFGTGAYGNYAKYSNPELDSMLGELDKTLDPDQRREMTWAIERILLTDLPALPTGCFIANFMPYYPYVKNIRWTWASMSNVNRFEDIWLDRELYIEMNGNPPPTIAPELTPTQTAEPSPTPSATPSPTPTAPSPSTTPPATSDNTTAPSYDRPEIPIIWLAIDPPEAIHAAGTTVTFKIKLPSGSRVTILYILPVTGTRSTTCVDTKTADASGEVTLSFSINSHINAGEGTLELTVIQPDGTTTIVTRPYVNR